MATKFSPCKGSYVLNQFPSNVMFGMNGFHVSASGAIQGHHGPLVFFYPKVIVFGGNMLQLKVDVIVNAANEEMKLTGGLAAAILKSGTVYLFATYLHSN